MSGKVYCYGGLVYTSTTENKADNIMNVLDITDSNGTSSDDLQNMWKTVSYIPNNVDLLTRTDPQCLVISDQNRMIINGGYASSSKQLNNMNIIYNAELNGWYAHEPYTEPPYGKRQMFVRIQCLCYTTQINHKFLDTMGLPVMYLVKVLHFTVDSKCMCSLK